MSLLFRPVNYKTDRENVYEITKSSGFFEEREVLLALKYFDENLEDGEDSSHTFLFGDLNGRTIAYTNYGEASYGGYSYYIHWIAVHNDMRGQGYGKIILFETEKIIKDLGARRIFVETSSKEEYRATQEFYYRCGYKLEARLKQFYSPIDDQLILSKDI